MHYQNHTLRSANWSDVWATALSVLILVITWPWYDLSLTLGAKVQHMLLAHTGSFLVHLSHLDNQYRCNRFEFTNGK
jgi:hypothetical protein